MFRICTLYASMPPLTDAYNFLANYRNLLETLEIQAEPLLGYEYTGDINHPVVEVQQMMLGEFFTNMNLLSMSKVNHPSLFLYKCTVANSRVIFIFGYTE